MKKILFVSCALVSFAANSAFACPMERYRVRQIAFDANGVVTRSEAREVNGGWQNIVVDKIKLESGDEMRLNADPSMADASVYVTLKRSSQKSDSQGIFHTTYTIRETHTSGWSGEIKETLSLVTVKSNYVGKGVRTKNCGTYTVKRLPNSTSPSLRD